MGCFLDESPALTDEREECKLDDVGQPVEAEGERGGVADASKSTSLSSS